MYKICLVEDEINLNNIIYSYLDHEGYSVVPIFNGREAIKYVGTDNIDLWILDIMLGDDVSGYDVIKKVKENNKDVPVIFTSARDQDLDRIIGLELGSDDYLAKPYSPKELVLRVNKIIERVYNKQTDKMHYGNYAIDIDKREVTAKDEIVKLTTLEYDLLLLFLNNKNKSFSREDILVNVWGNDYFGSDRVVDDLVRRLRHKMPEIRVNTLYGFGYRLT